jgi:CheY-like chemotaxis protein
MSLNNDKSIKKQLLSPLNVVLGYIQLFEMDNNLSASQKARIKKINQSLEQILDIMKQLPENIDYEKSNEDGKTDERKDNNLILVVEDNLTNQELLLQQLEMLGYSADTANNGQEALDKLKQTNYPLILTDLNMPLIDGYLLTKIIRENEQGSSRHIIIIAITANAFVGEENKCLQLGMDGYLSKPLNIHNLNLLLEKWNAGLSYSQPQVTIQNQEACDNDQILDKSCLIRSLGDDPFKHLIVLKSYIKHAPDSIKELINAYNNRDLEQVRFFSHKIKSSSYSIGATELADANRLIEQAADDDNWGIIDKTVPNIEKLFAIVESAINNEILNNKENS